MSFSSDIKSKILEDVSILNKECCRRSETFGEYITLNRYKSALERDYLDLLEFNNIDECCIRSIITGSFLSSGYITDPNLDYHLEVIFKNKALADYYIKLLSMLDFTPKYVKREVGKSVNHVVYVKEAEQISTYLSIIGASAQLLKFEQIRVEKDVKNNLNRNINCETANLTKIIKSSLKQIDAINELKKAKKYNSINDKLKEAAKIRIKYPEDSLESLALKLGITKSGMKHRLDKIVKMSENIK